MAYSALYRVWRPERFQDIVGQEPITKTLQSALAREKTSHAYLFAGPRGTGKTSAAKIMARAVNCEKAPCAEPCNECSVCRGILEGTISDVIEIDAASNNGVDEIRDIRDKVKYAPSAAKYKVYIIDEVHMLSTGAFNALLKTLEEPPRHAMFILATTEPHKIPLTIVSRCQRFDFRKIPAARMTERLQQIVNHLSITADDEALATIAHVSDGGMRDALSILDQAISYGDEQVTLEDVLAITGTVSRYFLTETVRSAYEQNSKRALELVDELVWKGKDPTRFLEDLIFFYRDLLLYKTSPQLEQIKDQAAGDEAFQSLAQKLDQEAIYGAIEILSESQQQMKWTHHPRIFLELSVVKLCQWKKKRPNEKEAVQLDPASGANRENDALIERIKKLEKDVETLKKRLEGERKEQGPANIKMDRPQAAEQKVPRKSGSTGNPDRLLSRAEKRYLQRLRARWPEIMEKLRKEKISVHACLIDSKPVACAPDAFLLAFKYDIHCRMVSENQNRAKEAVEEAVAGIYGERLSMVPVTFSEWEKMKERFIRKQKATVKKKEEDPLIAEAEKLVGKNLLEIKE